MSLQGPEARPREARWSRRRGLGSDEACHVSSFPLAEEPDAKEQREKQMPSATEQQGNSGDRGGRIAARVSLGRRGARQGPLVAPAWTWRAGCLSLP